MWLDPTISHTAVRHVAARPLRPTKRGMKSNYVHGKVSHGARWDLLLMYSAFWSEWLITAINCGQTGFRCVPAGELTEQRSGKTCLGTRRPSRPSRKTLEYVNMHPVKMMLFMFGLDILMYLQQSHQQHQLPHYARRRYRPARQVRGIMLATRLHATSWQRHHCCFPPYIKLYSTQPRHLALISSRFRPDYCNSFRHCILNLQSRVGPAQPPRYSFTSPLPHLLLYLLLFTFPFLTCFIYFLTFQSLPFFYQNRPIGWRS